MFGSRSLVFGLVFLSFCPTTILTGCKSAPAPDSRSALQDIHKEVVRGNLALASQKVKLQRATTSGDCADCASQLRLLEAEILTQQRKFQEVLDLLEQDRDFPSPTIDTAVKRKLFCGYAHSRLGKKKLADIELSDAEDLAERAHSSLMADVLQIRGVVALHRDEFAASRSAFSKSLEIAKSNDNKYVEAGDLLDLGVLAIQAEQYGAALDQLSASASLAQSIDAREILERDLGNIGWTQYRIGDYQKALVNLQQAEEQAGQLGSVTVQIDWMDKLGKCLTQLGEMKQAESTYQVALQNAQKLHDEELIEDISIKLSALDLRVGNTASAKARMNEAVQASSSVEDKFTEINLVLLQGLIATREHNMSEAAAYLNAAYRESDYLPSVRWYTENALGELAASSGQLRQADSWYRKSITTFEAQRASVKDEEMRLPFVANGDELYRDYAEFLIGLQKPDDALRVLDLGRAKTLAEGLGQSASLEKDASNTEDIAASEGAIILFYSLGQDKSWLWAVDSAHTQLFTLPGKLEIESRVAAYQKAILRSSDPVREENAEARQLYDAIVAPAASMMPQGSKVIVIPDGVLNQLNFETLLVPGKPGLHYWIEDVTITNANAIRLLPRSKPPVDAGVEKTLLLMGNPVSSGAAFDSLPHAAAEVESIESRFPANDRKVLTQAAAVPAAYSMSKPEQFSYIHFVAHGTASRLSPLDSAVVLSPTNGDQDNYKLYARDILRQPIHADLVTISACVGSGVRSYAGEGLVGLSWAFLRAGSHHVIGALWNVDDASTPELMDELYRGLRSGNGPDTALRNAKLMLIHSDGVYRKPLYWAAFQLYAGS